MTIRTTTITDALRDIADEVEGRSVRKKALEIIDTSDDTAFTFGNVVRLHEYVKNNISYVEDPTDEEYIAPPDETLELGAGDCDCQTVLLTSLYCSVGIPCRVLGVYSEELGYHALGEVRLVRNKDPGTAAESLRNFYSKNDIRGDIRRIASYEERDGYWYVADSVNSRYIGDIRALKEGGYIQDGEWIERQTASL